MGKPRRKPDDWVPHTNTVRQWCRALGCWEEYKTQREGYKLQGLTAREAKVRALKEMDMRRKHEEFKERQSMSRIIGSDVPLTDDEVKEVIPKHQRPGDTLGADVGEEAMSLPEQIKWAKREVAKRQNGGPVPAYFPNYDVLYWFQRAVRNQSDFDKIVMKMEAPTGEGGDAFLRDGEYQFEQIEGQLQDALKESGSQLLDLEEDFVELLGGFFTPISPEAEALL